MITCQIILDNDDVSVHAMADMFELNKSHYGVFIYFLDRMCDPVKHLCTYIYIDTLI